MALQSGDIFASRYRVDQHLGAGGFGDVYLVTDVATQQVAALKLLRAVDEQARARFAREVAIVERLKSPHTVALLDAGVASGGLHYAVFEYIPGRDLSEVLSTEHTLPRGVVDHILRQLLESLDEAHRLGLLHRDLKPENIRVFEADGDPWRVKLLDFGIARATDGGHPSLTATGELIGTPRYMSPEQLTSRPLTQASDIYSLGVVALEMIVGRDALHGNAWGDQIDRMSTDYAPNFAALEQAGPLRDAILQMMQKHPADRPASVAQLWNMLDGRKTVPAAVSPTPVGSSPSRTKLIGGVFIGVLVLVAITVALVLGVQDEPTPEQGDGTRPNPLGPPAAAPAQIAPPPDAQPPPPLAANAGCGQKPPFEGSGFLRADLFATSGTLAHIPSEYDPAHEHALVVLLHDEGQSPDSFLRDSGWADLADRRGFVVIAPASTPVKAWDGDYEVQDVVAAVEMTSDVLCIDRDRIFTAGQGAGGQEAFEMFCAEPVRAGAKNNHLIRGASPNKCPRKPMIMINSRRSVYFPVEGGLNCQGNRRNSVQKERAIWRQALSCDEDGRVWHSGPHGSCTTWSCETPFVSCLTNGGGAWPGTVARPSPGKKCTPNPPVDFPTTERIWAFFEGLDQLGCGVEPPFHGLRKLTAPDLGSWITYIPKSAGSTPMPMIMLLHQAEEGPREMLEVSGFIELAEKHGFVVVAPGDEKADPWKDESTTPRLTAIAKETSRQLCIDETRQFIVAHGQGGRAAELMPCSAWVDGIATNSHRSSRMSHQCDRPIPHITLAGTKTRHEPVEGGKNCRGLPKLSLADWEEKWRRRNRCNEARTTTFQVEESRCFTYSGCAEPLVSCHLDGGHGWPGSMQRSLDKLPGPFNKCDGEPPDFPTAARIWKFLDGL